MDFYLQQGLHSRKQSGLSAVNVSLVRQFEAPTTTAQVVAAVTSLPPSPTRMPRFVAPLPGSRPTSSKDPSQTTHTPLTPPPSHPSLRRTPPPVYGALNNAPPPATPIPAMPSPAVPRLGGSITVLDTPNPEESPAIQPPQIIVEGDSSESLDSPVILPTEIADEEEELSEQQLRELYDEEEMERFLHMFSTYVREVRMPEQPGGSPKPHMVVETDLPPSPAHIEFEESVASHEDGDWVPVHSPDDAAPPSLPPRPVHYEHLSERIAMQYVMPLLPPAPPVAPSFSLGRLKMAIERLYLAVEPAYLPFLIRIHRLATWQDWNTSCIWCSVFWLLWLQNLILPALVARILYSLFRRRLLPYPSLAELRTRRADADRAARFGDRVHARLALRPGSEFGFEDAWRAVKLLNRPKKPGKGKGTDSKDNVAGTDAGAELADEALPKSEEEKLKQEEQDMKQLGLTVLSDMADLHERVRNIFLWRQPSISVTYGLVLVALLLTTLFVPAKYLAKGVYFSLGFAFWHVIPVLAALPASARARIPPPLSEVPTDTDYAMHLMAERVACGLPVRPTPRHRKRAVVGAFGRSAVSLVSPNASTLSLGTTSENLAGGSRNVDQDEVRDGSRDWVRDAVKAVDTGKAWWGDGVKLMKAVPSGTLPSKTELLSSSAPGTGDAHPFLAQHTKLGPGLLTLTSTTLFFAPFVSRATAAASPSLQASGSSPPAPAAAKLTVALSDVRGVKKTGAFSVRGLAIRWADERAQEREERFLWVRGREEAFARLVGAERRWLRV